MSPSTDTVQVITWTPLYVSILGPERVAHLLTKPETPRRSQLAHIVQVNAYQLTDWGLDHQPPQADWSDAAGLAERLRSDEGRSHPRPRVRVVTP